MKELDQLKAHLDQISEHYDKGGIVANQSFEALKLIEVIQAKTKELERSQFLHDATCFARFIK